MKYLYSLIFGMVCTLFGFGIVFHIVKFSLVIVAVYLLVVTALSIWINKKHHNHFTIGLPVVSLLFGIIYGIIEFKDYFCLDGYSAVVFLLFAVLTSHIIRAKHSTPNGMFGIRTTFCMEYPAVWSKTHTFFSVFATSFLPAMLFLVLFGAGTIRIVIACILFILPPIVAAYFSNIYGSKYHKVAEAEEKAELQKQLEKEQGYWKRQ